MKTKTRVLLLFLAISTLSTYGQEFRERHIQKLESLGIPYNPEYSTNAQATKDLHQVLYFDFKRKAKITTGSVLLTVGLGGLIGGILLINDESNNGKAHAPREVEVITGIGCLALGATGVGISIPMFISAKKHKKNRDELKKTYQSDRSEKLVALQSAFLRDSQGQN
tara:strand:- start:658 stop:1158 length:501 start_codon:yes stop_codon:yes gene_type:complete